MTLRAAAAALLLLPVWFAGACGDDAGSALDPWDTRPSSDIVVADTTGGSDTATPADSAQPVDTGPSDDTIPSADTGRVEDGIGETAAANDLVKADPTFLVPAGTALRRHVALAGARVAWVERDAPGETPRLVTWDASNLDTPPRRFDVANLADPRELAVDGDTLVYVDVRFGDPDVFALDLVSGDEQAIVTRPGVQRFPSVAAGRLVWEDCRRCVSGDDGAGADIFLRDLATGAEQNLTDDDLADRRPVLGTLAGGQLAVAWVHDETTLRVSGLDDATDVAWPLGQKTDGVALTGGVLAWRPSPFIINPDSMMPSDLFLTAVSDGATFPATFHGERLGALDAVPRGAAGRFAFLGSPPNAPTVTRLRVVGVDASAVRTEDVPALATSLAVSAGWVAITAPRADNGGFDDVWVVAQGAP